MDILTDVVIFPISFLLETVFAASCRVFRSFGEGTILLISIAATSVCVTLLCLPLYAMAEAWQQKEREAKRAMADRIKKIKRSFSGDEQMLRLQAFYRERRYHPAMALRSSLGILIQIPFFLAAYRFLSDLPALKGTSCAMIDDLGAPDGLIRVGATKINLLPVLMTAINCVSGAIYSKGHGEREKIQIYSTAAVFLVLLYKSPAGLVIYWTLNNVLSLAKNIFYKLRHPIRALYVCLCVLSGGFALFLIAERGGRISMRLFASGIFFLVLTSPALVSAAKWQFAHSLSREKTGAFFAAMSLSCISATLLGGIYVVSAAVASSPVEFSMISGIENPLQIAKACFFKSFGLFFFWPMCAFLLFSKKVKSILAEIAFAASVLAALDVFVFTIGKNASGSVLTRLLTFFNDSFFSIRASELAQDILIFIAACSIFCILSHFRRIRLLNAAIFAEIAAILVASGLNLQKIKHSATIQLSENPHSAEATLNLSKNGRNVVVLMLDRFVGGYVDELSKDFPELPNQFDGFQWYENCISFGRNTVFAVPPLWGGPDFAPFAMNGRGESIKRKYNEALLTLPTIFAAKNFDVTVTDTSFANFADVSDLSLYDGLKNVTALKTEGAYTSLWMRRAGVEGNDGENGGEAAFALKNTFNYAVISLMPRPFRAIFYQRGAYLNMDSQASLDPERLDFIDSFSALDMLPNICKITDCENAAIFMTNDATHAETFLDWPSLTLPKNGETKKKNGKFGENETYYTDAAAILAVSRWLDFLRENKIYDNTRIIVVSDHGYDVPIFSDEKSCVSREHFNPLLLVKDFNAHGPLRRVEKFMTNADVPLLATKDIVENASNPFTGNIFSEDYKQKPLIVTNSKNWMPNKHSGSRFSIADDEWFSFEGENIFDASGWKPLGD